MVLETISHKNLILSALKSKKAQLGCNIKENRRKIRQVLVLSTQITRKSNNHHNNIYYCKNYIYTYMFTFSITLRVPICQSFKLLLKWDISYYLHHSMLEIIHVCSRALVSLRVCDLLLDYVTLMKSSI